MVVDAGRYRVARWVYELVTRAALSCMDENMKEESEASIGWWDEYDREVSWILYQRDWA